MPPSIQVQSAPDTGAPSRHISAETRLQELKRSLQRQLKRRPTVAERAALDRAALMSLRAEIAAYSPQATSEDVVRLDNCARRARADFERIAAIVPPKAKQRRMSLQELEQRYGKGSAA